MDLYEYQARDLFEKYEVPVLAGIIADTAEEAKAAAEKIGGVVVVKAQVKVGGRGKAGGVKVAKTPEEAYEAAQQILGLDIKGHIVKRVMVAAARASPRSTTSRSCSTAPTAPTSASPSVEGGMEIEQVAVDEARGPRPHRGQPADRCRRGQGRSRSRRPPASMPSSPRRSRTFRQALGRSSSSEDATLVEVNPLVLDRGGRHPRPRRQGLARRERRRSATPTTLPSKTRTPPTRSRRRPRRTT